MSLSLGTGPSYQQFKLQYTITMITMWYFGVDVPRLWIRYGKAYPGTINVHSMSMLIIGLLTLMEVVAGIVLYLKEANHILQPLTGLFLAHFVLVIILCTLILLTFLLGLITRSKMNRTIRPKFFFSLKLWHKVLGTSCSLLGKAIVIIIAYLSGNDTFARAIQFSLAAILLVWFILEIIYRSQTRSIIWKFAFRHNNRRLSQHHEILDRLNEQEEDFEDYHNQGVRYVLVDNCMYYIDQDFMHPGGEHIFTVLNGREVNYFLKGAKEMALGYPRHEHTKFVAKYLENRLIGEMEVEPILLNQKVTDELIEWRVISNQKGAHPGCHWIGLETDGGYIRQSLKAANFGKYVMMKCASEELLGKVERPYYLLLSLCEWQTTQLQRLRLAYKECYLGEAGPADEPLNKLTSTLYFVMKDYKKGVFTRYLFNSPKDRVFSLSGPFGYGLSLKPTTNDYIIIVAAGIGLLPFVDLLNFLLQRTLLSLVSLRSSPSSRHLESGENYTQLAGLRVLLIGSFTSPDKFYFSTPIKELYYLNTHHDLKQFDLMLRYDNGQDEQEIRMIKEPLSVAYLHNIFETEEPDRVYFSGPMELEWDLRKAEHSFQLKHKIYFV